MFPQSFVGEKPLYKGWSLISTNSKSTYFFQAFVSNLSQKVTAKIKIFRLLLIVFLPIKGTCI